MQKRFVLIIIAVLFSRFVTAQEHWTLERCIQYAIDNNIKIKQQTLNSNFYKNQKTAAKLSVLPSVNASAYESFRFGRSVDPYTNEFTEHNTQSTNMDISARMDLFRGGQHFHEMKKAELNLQASLKDLEKAKNDLSVNIANAFFNILYSQEMLEVTTRQLETTRQQVVNTEKLVNAGSLAQSNLLEIQAQLANEELQTVNAQNSLDLAYLTLIQYLELDTVKNFKIAKPDIKAIDKSSVLPEVRQVYLEAEMNMPEIHRSELNLSIAERELAIARSNYYPSLSLSAAYGSGYSDAQQIIDKLTPSAPMLIGYGINNNTGDMFDVYRYGYDYTYKTKPFSDQMRDNASASVSLGLSIPIFNRWQVKTAVNNAKINKENQRYNVDLVKKQLFREIQQAYSDANAALRQYMATEKALLAMQESFRYTKQRFDVGLVTSLEFNTAKTQLNKTESDLLRAKYEFVFKQKILDFYRGIPITISQ